MTESTLPQSSNNFVLRFPKTAMLVIHGIGEQNPYETLDNFGRHVADYLRAACRTNVNITPAKIDHNDWVEARIRLQLENANRDIVDIYEYYWAPYTEDKITYRGTLSWLIKADLTPLRHLEDNLVALEDDQPKRMTPAQVFWREIRRIVWLYIPLLFLLALLLWWIPDVSKIPDWFSKDLLALFKSSAVPQRVAEIFMTISFVTCALLLFFGIRGALARKRKTQLRFPWEAWTIACGVLALAVGLAIGLLAGVDLRKYFEPFLNTGTLEFAGAYLIGWALRYFLKGYVGDVAVYVNADAKSKNYAARTAVLSGATTALTRILRDQGERYDQVILAGHSLGSVVSYDAINELLNKATALPDQVAAKKPESQITLEELQKLRGLVTFGSPLDKVYYFFRDYTAPDQVIRSQVLSYLHSFRKHSSRRKYDPYTFERYLANLLPELIWLNAWAKLDPVSGPLHFYDVNFRQSFPYAKPVLAHLSYWEDPHFYQFFGKELLVVEQPEVSVGVGAP